MQIKTFKRIDNYFSGFDLIKADSLDSQFDNIGSYLNKEVLPNLNTLLQGKVKGSTNPANINKFLKNLGDKSTRWSAIDNDSFADNSIHLRKLVKSNIGAVIAANASGILQGVAPSYDNQVLVSRANNTPVWKKLTNNNIKDREITGDNVADKTITKTNIPDALLSVPLANDSITGDKFITHSITNSKIANNTLTAEKLNPYIRNIFSNTVWENIIPNNYLTTATNILSNWNGVGSERSSFMRMFLEAGVNCIPNSNNQPTINYKIPASKFMINRGSSNTQTGFSVNHIMDKLHCATKLQNNSMDANRVAIWLTGNTYEPRLRKEMSRLVEDEAIELRHLASDLRGKFEAARLYEIKAI